MRRWTKKTVCPECAPDDKSWFERQIDYSKEGNPEYWECNNCGHRLPARARPQARPGLTPSQEKVIAAVKARMAEHLGDDGVRDEVTEAMGTGAVSYRATFGQDHIFLERRLHVIIGRRGGIKGFEGDRLVSVPLWKVPYTSTYFGKPRK